MADKLIPKDHGFGTRRVPLESGYFENVTLIDTYRFAAPRHLRSSTKLERDVTAARRQAALARA